MPPEQTLLERTLSMLKEDKRTTYAIARDAGLNYYWVRNMKKGRILEPGVDKVQKLHDFLITPVHA